MAAHIELRNYINTPEQTQIKSEIKSPIRILHVVDALHRGGIETWLLQVLRLSDRQRLQMDFLVHNPSQPGDLTEEIRALGSNIILFPYLYKPWIYGNNFRKILTESDSYDILHVHAYNYLSGYILRWAKQAGIKTRIAHSHTDSSQIESESAWYKRLSRFLTKYWTDRYATLGLGCSRRGAASLFGEAWETDPRWQLLYCGIDPAPFHTPVNSVAVRRELGIPEDAFVLGHVGRFDEHKNHQLIVDIAVEVAKCEPKTHLLLVGEGRLRSQIEAKVSQIGMSDRVTFTGKRSDIPRLMLGAMDVFLFPSVFEGLGLVLLEAQSAGLPCIFSDVIPEEADVVKPLVQRLSLKQPTSVWVNAVLSAYTKAPGIKQTEALAILEQSQFNIYKSIEDLTQIYELHSRHLLKV